MARHAEDESRTTRLPGIEWKQRVRADAGEERARMFAVKACAREPVDRAKCSRLEAEASERDGMARRDERREQRVEQRVAIVDERAEELAIRATVLSERRRGRSSDR